MGRKTFYGEQGEIERICHREGCYYRINGKCGNSSNGERIGKICREENGEKCKNWRIDRKWKDKKQYQS